MFNSEITIQKAHKYFTESEMLEAYKSGAEDMLLCHINKSVERFKDRDLLLTDAKIWLKKYRNNNLKLKLWK